MKKLVFALAVLGFGLICLQQKSYAEKKTAHAEFKDTAIKECNSCHKSEGVALNHDADFVRGHRILAGKAGNNCAQCHEQKWCLDCHKGGSSGDTLSQDGAGRDYKPKSHRSDFISIHPLKAQGNQQQCYRCHDAVSFCNSCHIRFPKGRMQIKSHMMFSGPKGPLATGMTGASSTMTWTLGEHATEARRNLQSCQTCHPEGDVCIQCHSTGRQRFNNGTLTGPLKSPHPKDFKAGNFKNRTNAKMCLKCHLPGTY